MLFENNRLSELLKSHYSADVNDYSPLQPSRPVIVGAWSPEDVTDWMLLSRMCVNGHVASLFPSLCLNPTLSLQRATNDVEGPGGNLDLSTFKCFLHTRTCNNKRVYSLCI